MKKLQKSVLVFSRKENDSEYLLYSAVSRGVHVVPSIVWRFWNQCEGKSIKQMSSKLNISDKDAEKIFQLLFERDLIKYQ